MTVKKRARLCLYVFLVLSFVALGILGYFVFNRSNDNVMAGSKKFVTFNSVKNATSYSIVVDENKSASYTIEKNEILDKNNCFKFVVDVSIGDKKIAEESYIQEIESENAGTNKIDCKITDYTIIFFDDDGKVVEDKKIEYIDQKLKDVDKNIFCVVVSEYFDDVFVLDGFYTIKCIPFDENNEEITNSDGTSLAVTEEIDYKAYYKNDFLRRGEYFYGGKWYDYVIDSKEELKAFVWRTILYRGSQDGETFYVNTEEINSGNINALVFDAIDSYPEYSALNDNNMWAYMNENVGALTRFSYYLSEDFTKTSDDLDMTKLSYEQRKRVEQSKYEIYRGFDVVYVTASEDSERNFAIDSERKDKTITQEDKRRKQSGVYEASEVEVYNTEQLFMVVQSGGRPVFPQNENGEKSVAEQVYENALNVLKKINNSDSLSEYEKALNIYNYLTGEIVYDWTVYTYMEQTGSFLVSDFGEYSCFYLEGVFYGDGTHYAVCDGLAKAYSLMCNIEGIECEKINGEVQGGAHAWNRVLLEEDTSRGLEAGHYYVDCTWGEGKLAESSSIGTKKYQFLTHNYFLFKQDNNSQAENEKRYISYPTIDIEDSKQYEYYKNTLVESTINDEKIEANCFVENYDNFENVVKLVYQNYLDSNKNTYVELKFSKDYFNNNNFKTFITEEFEKVCAKLNISKFDCDTIVSSSDNLFFVIFK